MKHFIGIRFSRYGQVRIGSFENINEDTFAYGDAVVIQNDSMLSLGHVVWQSDHLASLCASHKQASHEEAPQSNPLCKENQGEHVEQNTQKSCCEEKTTCAKLPSSTFPEYTTSHQHSESFSKNIIRTKGPFAESFEATQVQQYSLVRYATAEEKRIQENNKTFCDQAHKFCKKCIRERELDMKLVDVESLLDRSKIIFYFTAPTRIDFRELVKDLVREYRTRIELRQISVRHETQMLGTLGNCGMAVCCRRYLKEFVPVTIKMAKEQNLFLNPTKISGMCGRLLCCLSYEQEGYEAFHKVAPKVGKTYQTDRGFLRVLRTDMFHNIVIVQKNEDPEESINLDIWHTLRPKIADNQQYHQGQKSHYSEDTLFHTSYESSQDTLHRASTNSRNLNSNSTHENYAKDVYNYQDVADEYSVEIVVDDLDYSQNNAKQDVHSSIEQSKEELKEQSKRKHKSQIKQQAKQRVRQQMRPREKAQKRASFDDEN